MLQIAWHFNIIVITINFKPKFLVNLWLVQCNYYYFVASLVVQTVKHLQCRGPGFSLWVRKIPWRRKWQPTPVLLPGKSHGQRSLAGCSPWGCRVGQDWATSTTTSFILQISLSWLGHLSSLQDPAAVSVICVLSLVTEPNANTQWGKGQWCVVLRCFSPVWLSVTPWNVNCQDPLSMRFSRQEYWSGFPCFSPGNLLDPGIEPTSLESLALAGGFFTTSATWEAP